MLYLGIISLTGEISYAPVRTYFTELECQQRGSYAAEELAKLAVIKDATYFCVSETAV